MELISSDLNSLSISSKLISSILVLALASKDILISSSLNCNTSSIREPISLNSGFATANATGSKYWLFMSSVIIYKESSYSLIIQ